MANIYYQKAQQQYDPSYNQKVQALKNQLAQNQQNLEQQKGGINANYDNQVAQQNLQNRYSKNNFSNTMLGRGIANSSITGTGLAEMDMKNNRLIGDINNARLGDLNNIEQQKAILAQNMNNTLAQMNADRENELWSIAYKLEDRDKDWQYKQSQLALQRQAQAMEAEYKRAQMAQMQKENQPDYRAVMGELEYIMNDPELTIAQQKQALKSYKAQYHGAGSKELDALINKYNTEITGREQLRKTLGGTMSGLFNFVGKNK